MATECHEEGLVTGSAPDGRALVTVARGEACHSCEARGACQALGGPTSDLVVAVENPVGAALGDRVVLTMDEAAVVKASAVLYLIPALCLVGGATIGWAVASARAWDADPLAIAGCIAGLAIGLVLARIIGRRLSGTRTFVPRITSIAERAEDGDTK